VVNRLDLYERVVLAPVLNLTRRHNTGAAFSVLADIAPFFFVALALAVSVGVLVWLRRNPDHERLTAVGLCLILGGALGNAIDRATRGHVIDFIDVHAAGWHWPAFNVADSAIMIGAALIVADMLFRPSRERNG
jgi:signal peptidase II